MAMTNSETQMVLKHRRDAAYKMLKQIALERLIMKHWKDSEGYDRFINKLNSGEFKLELVENDTD